jgi:hypothetical protein
LPRTGAIPASLCGNARHDRQRGRARRRILPGGDGHGASLTRWAMSDPLTIARRILAELPTDPADLTDAHLPTIKSALAISLRLSDEILQRQKKLAALVEQGDRWPRRLKELKRIDRQMSRLFESEELLQPFVDQAMAIEAGGERL